MTRAPSIDEPDAANTPTSWPRAVSPLAMSASNACDPPSCGSAIGVTSGATMAILTTPSSTRCREAGSSRAPRTEHERCRGCGSPRRRPGRRSSELERFIDGSEVDGHVTLEALVLKPCSRNHPTSDGQTSAIVPPLAVTRSISARPGSPPCIGVGRERRARHDEIAPSRPARRSHRRIPDGPRRCPAQPTRGPRPQRCCGLDRDHALPQRGAISVVSRPVPAATSHSARGRR